MTTLTFTSSQSWSVPSDCRTITSIEAVGSGDSGVVGSAAIFDANGNRGGPGGNGGGGGARAIEGSFAVVVGHNYNIVVGVGGGTYSGVQDAATGTWVCLAYSASGQTGGTPYVGNSYQSRGSDGAPGSPAPSQFVSTAGGNGGNGGQSDYAGGGVGGTGGQLNVNAPGGNGSNGTTWGAGGGGGGGGAYTLGIDESGGNPGTYFPGFVQIIYTPYVPKPPTVTSVSPTKGSPGGGQTVTITGTNFNNSVSTVTFGGIAANSFTVNSATQITAVTPRHNPGVFDVLVTNVDGTNPSTSADYFTFKAGGGFNQPMGGL